MYTNYFPVAIDSFTACGLCPVSHSSLRCRRGEAILLKCLREKFRHNIAEKFDKPLKTGNRHPHSFVVDFLRMDSEIILTVLWPTTWPATVSHLYCKLQSSDCLYPMTLMQPSRHFSLPIYTLFHAFFILEPSQWSSIKNKRLGP